jgi:MFS transporter, ACS family, hexuronate transporter
MADQNSTVEAEPGGPGQASASSSTDSRSGRVFAGNFRWVICGLLFFGVTKNYMDRQVLGVLKGPLQHEFSWNDIDYGNLVFAFQAAYALGMVFVGRLIDRFGTRIGYAVAMVFWSLASMGHAIAFSLPSFIAA